MYKVTYKAGKGNLEVLNVEKIKNHSWLEETDQDKINQIKDNFYLDKNIFWVDLDGEAHGIAVYSSKFKYITGHLNKIVRSKSDSSSTPTKASQASEASET